MHRAVLAAAAIAVLAATGCTRVDPNAPTYWRDVKPLAEGICLRCHAAGGIGPIRLETYEDFYAERGRVREKVLARLMPPWLPADGCNVYRGDRSLTDEEIATVVAWVDSGAAEGDEADYPGPRAFEDLDVSRVDLTIAMPDPYTPTLSPDDYRCFVIDWPETGTTYVSGFRVRPGEASIVHHVIAYVAGPADAAALDAADAAEPGPGYTCFGGPGVDAAMLGAWAPGMRGQDYLEGTGIEVAPGSKISLQVHYNTLEFGAKGPLPPADLSEVDFKLESSVASAGALAFWGDPDWSSSLFIPAGQEEVRYSFGSTSSFPVPLRVSAVGAHMHLLGKSASMTVEHADGTETCLVDIPRWDFHWQGLNPLAEPVVVMPDDVIHVECTWDNSAANQATIDGIPVDPVDVTWGEGTTDEMCLGVVYLSL